MYTWCFQNIIVIFTLAKNRTNRTSINSKNNQTKWTWRHWGVIYNGFKQLIECKKKYLYVVYAKNILFKYPNLLSNHSYGKKESKRTLKHYHKSNKCSLHFLIFWGNSYGHTSFYCTLLHFGDIAFLFPNWRCVENLCWDNVKAPFFLLIAFAHIMSLFHILIIIAIFPNFSLLYLNCCNFMKIL